MIIEIKTIDEVKEFINGLSGNINIVDMVNKYDMKDVNKFAFAYFYDKNREDIEKVIKYKFITEEEICSLMKNQKEEIDLNGCYINTPIIIGNKENINELEKLNAEDSCFDCKIDFSNIKFKGIVNFNNSIFNEGVEFINTIFEKDIFFQDVVFKSSVTFRGAICKGFSFFRRTIFEEQVDFLETSFMKRVFFKKAAFKSRAHFMFAKIGECMSLPEIRIKNREDKIIIYRLASKSFEDVNRDVSDNYFYEYMKTKRKTKKYGFSRFMEKLFADLLIKYGTSWERIILASGLVILIFAFIYSFFNGIEPNSCFFQSLYFSTVTFVTLGYGDFTPKEGIFRFFASTESIIGAIFIAGFITIFSRKFTR